MQSKLISPESVVSKILWHNNLFVQGQKLHSIYNFRRRRKCVFPSIFSDAFNRKQKILNIKFCFIPGGNFINNVLFNKYYFEK